MIQIGQVGPEAADVLATIHLAAADDAWSASAIAQLLVVPGSAAFLAELRGEALAFVMVRVVAEEGEILTLATHPAHRRRGVARQIMTTAARFAQSTGSRRLLLEVATDNTAAIALYRGLGYVEVGVRRGYYVRKSGVVDARVLRLDL